MTALSKVEMSWPMLLDAATRPYRDVGPFTWRLARGKLGMDPVFPYLLQQGLIAPAARVLDIGCGQGLLASLLAACDAYAQKGTWSTAWAVPPRRADVVGIELMARDVLLGFSVQSQPMSQGTPFANVLLVARLNSETPLNAPSL